MTASIDITPAQRKRLLYFLDRYIPGVEVWAYGSRVKWTARPNSDLDLVAFAEPAQRSSVDELKDALAESNLPFLVDLHVWSEVPERFHAIIRKEYVVIQEKTVEGKASSVAGEESTIGALLDESGGSIKTGPFGTKLKASEYTATGVPVISVGEVGFGRLRIHHDTPRVDVTVSSRMPEFLLKAGDIVFGRKGAVERSAQVQPHEDGYFLGSDGIRIRLNIESCDPKFIAYQLQTTAHRSWMIQHAAGTTMPSLNEGIIRRIPIVLKPLTEQKAIAHILGTLDDKIEANRRMNETLEATARALFQSWFVDFDPVRAKAEGRQPYGMDAATASLFPDSFKESELGDIPEGWTVRSLDKTADYLNGLALQKFPPGNGDTLPVIKIAQLRKGDTEGADRCNTDLPSAYVIKDGDLLFSWSGSLEVEFWCGGVGALNQHLFKVSSSEFPKWFYYLWTRHHLEEFRRIAAAKATTMGHIQRGHLSDAKVLIPPRSLLDAMTRRMSPLIEQFISNRIQSRTLATLRDSLLPKLLSGELSATN